MPVLPGRHLSVCSTVSPQRQAMSLIFCSVPPIAPFLLSPRQGEVVAESRGSFQVFQLDCIHPRTLYYRINTHSLPAACWLKHTLSHSSWLFTRLASCYSCTGRQEQARHAKQASVDLQQLQHQQPRHPTLQLPTSHHRISSAQPPSQFSPSRRAICIIAHPSSASTRHVCIGERREGQVCRTLDRHQYPHLLWSSSTTFSR